MIRRATQADAKAIWQVEMACFTHTRLSLRSIRTLLQKPYNHLLVFENGERIVGYILTFCHRRSRLARHYSLAVLPEYQGKGIAKALLCHAETLCSDKAGFKLEVAVDNTSAARLYARLGYCVAGTRRQYYENGTDALEMVKLK